MFGIGFTKDLEEEIDYLQDLVERVVTHNHELVDKITKLEKKKSRKKYRRRLSTKTGFTKVTREEAEYMYDMYKNSISVDKIARELDRSRGCVDKHIRRLMEENNEERTS